MCVEDTGECNYVQGEDFLPEKRNILEKTFHFPEVQKVKLLSSFLYGAIGIRYLGPFFLSLLNKKNLAYIICPIACHEYAGYSADVSQ